MILVVGDPTLADRLMAASGVSGMEAVEDPELAIDIVQADRGDLDGVIVFWDTKTSPLVVAAAIGHMLDYPVFGLILLEHGVGHSIPPEWRLYIVHINSSTALVQAILRMVGGD